MTIHFSIFCLTPFLSNDRPQWPKHNRTRAWYSVLTSNCKEKGGRFYCIIYYVQNIILTFVGFVWWLCYKMILFFCTDWSCMGYVFKHVETCEREEASKQSTKYPLNHFGAFFLEKEAMWRDSTVVRGWAGPYDRWNHHPLLSRQRTYL